MICITQLHKANGLVERFNRTIQKYAGQVHKDMWEDYLDTCDFAYNTSVHESSRFTPYELMFGRKLKPVLPVDLQMERSVDDGYLDSLDQDQAGTCKSLIQNESYIPLMFTA